MERFVTVNGVDYPASIMGRVHDLDWDDRFTKTITVEMDYQTALATFVDNCSWAIKEVTYPEPTEEVPEPEPIVVVYDNSEFKMAGTIIDNRDGMMNVKMGKLNEIETLIEAIYGQVNSDMVSPNAPDVTYTGNLSPRAKAFYELFKRHMISIGAVRQAVIDGVITPEEYTIITGLPYEEA